MTAAAPQPARPVHPRLTPAENAIVMALRALAARRPAILGYHGVGTTPRSEDLFRLQISPALFRRQLELLQLAGFRFSTVAAAIDDHRQGVPLSGTAIVTFDDGLRNNFTIALPILQELRIPATLYVPSGWLGGQNPWIGDPADGAILTADELRELAHAGWEIGSHTRTHADLAQLDEAGCREEIESDMAALAELIGAPIRTLAYPFGHYRAAAVRAARGAGLIAAVTTGSRGFEPFELHRAMVSTGDPWPVLLLKLAGGYDPLLRAPPLRLARSLSKTVRRRIIARRAAA